MASTTKHLSAKKRAAQVDTEEMRRRVLECRRDGMTLNQMSDELGISAAWAGRLLKQALANITEEPAKEVLQIELERLDWYHHEASKILKGWHPFVQGGGVVVHHVTDPDDCTKKIAVTLEDVGPKLTAIRTLITVAERRAKLLGIDRPVKEKQENTPEEFAARIVAAVAAIDGMTAGTQAPPPATGKKK